MKHQLQRSVISVITKLSTIGVTEGKNPPVGGPLARRDHIHINRAGPRVCGGVLRRHSHEPDGLSYIAVFHKPEVSHQLCKY